MKFASTYICIEGKNVMQEGGYRTFPISAGRYEQAPGEVYGRSPAMMVLPALKTLNADESDVPEGRPPRRRPGAADL